MNIRVGLIAAAGLFLIFSATSASAHDKHNRDYDRYDDRREYRYYATPRPHGYRYVRANTMPRWLKQQRQFRSWYKHSRYKRRTALSWERLYDIYVWEIRHQRYRRQHW
jgi:hypothetical protein